MTQTLRAALVAVFFSLQGCTLNVPAGLLDSLTKTTKTHPATEASDDEDSDRAGAAQDAIVKGKASTTDPGMPIRPIAPPDCGLSIKGYDRDFDGRLSLDEFRSWFDQQPKPAGECTKTAVSDSGRTICLEGGSLSASAGGSVTTDMVVGGVIRVAEEGESGTKTAVAVATDPKSAFNALDHNQDRYLGPEEICGAPGMQPPMPMLPVQAPDCKELFLKADANADGHVDPEEYARYAPPIDNPMMSREEAGPNYSPYDAFKRRDMNGNGQLDPGEFCGMVAPPPPPVDTTGCSYPKEADANADGGVDFGEYFTWQIHLQGESLNAGTEVYAEFKDRWYAEFTVRDHNGDGKVMPEEWCDVSSAPTPIVNGASCFDVFFVWDTNRDKYLSYDEYAAGKWSQLRFFKAPTPEEEKAAKAAFFGEAYNYDKDMDKRLSLDEFGATCSDADAVSEPAVDDEMGYE